MYQILEQHAAKENQMQEQIKILTAERDKDYADMRKFQEKYIASDQRVRELMEECDKLKAALNTANTEINKLQAMLATTSQHLQVALAARSE